MVFTLRPFGHTAGSFVQWAIPHGGTISRSSGIVRLVQGGVVKTFRYVTSANVSPRASPVPDASPARNLHLCTALRYYRYVRWLVSKPR